jgi:hypothetical protein
MNVRGEGSAGGPEVHARPLVAASTPVPRRTGLRTVLPFVCLVLFLSPVAAQSAVEAQLDPEERARIVSEVARVMAQAYVYEDLGTRMSDHIKGQLADGSYDDIGALHALTRRLTLDLISISHDGHIRVMPLRSSAGTETLPDQELENRRLATLQNRNFDFYKLERLTGNLGLMELRGFPDPKEALPTVEAAMNFLAHSNALIIDLRMNGGGTKTMVQLLSSYFFGEPTHLTTQVTRRDGISEEVWTHKVDGSLVHETPVLILTSKDTFSAAEGFAYHLQARKRAIIVGEVTGGGAHLVDFVDVPDLSLTIKVPVTRNVNPVTGTDWEGQGVKPDIEVSADDALDAACNAAGDILWEAEPNADKRDVIRFHQFRYAGWEDHVQLDAMTREGYVGTYIGNGMTTVVAHEDERLVVLLPGGTIRLPMRALNRDRFVAGEEFNMEMLRNGHGEVERVVVTYVSGDKVHRDEFKKAKG